MPTPPEACPICGAGAPVPVSPAGKRRRHMQGLWQYACGHRYAVYAPDPSQARQVVREFIRVRAKAHGARGRSGRRKGTEKVAQSKRRVIPLDLLPNPKPPRPVLHRVCPCGVEFTTRDPRQVYHDRTCRLRFEKQRQRARKAAAGGAG